MRTNQNKSLKVMIIEDEEDILNLYRDFLCKRGYNVVSCSEDASNIETNFETYEPDICIIDHMVGGKGVGIDAATQILAKSPSTPVLFITAYESMKSELARHHEFDDRKVQVLLKPTRLPEIEDSLLNMVNN